jgi:serine/threonine protein kinase
MDLLKKEAVFQDQLDHPRIVKTIGLNTQHDPPYFIMEYVEGKNLRQLMLEDGILPPLRNRYCGSSPGSPRVCPHTKHRSQGHQA